MMSLVLLSGCSTASGPTATEARYSIVSVNNKSPDQPVPIGFTQYRISIPRASVILRVDGSVMEVMQYVITHQSNATRIESTDTTYGSWVKTGSAVDVRMPDAHGSEVYAGYGEAGGDALLLTRSWQKQGVLVAAELAYYRSR